jgi:glyoxylase-like metal-dependent hydrolase (beta-lactamase superfamily II)
MKRHDSGTNFVRYAVGDLTVIALRDGYVDLPASRLRKLDSRPFNSDLPTDVELIQGKLRLSVNVYLVIDGSQHVLIDTGAANSWDPTMGLLPHALAEAGMDINEITTVALTHTHQDHGNGLVAADGSDAFPNLQRLLVPKEEVGLFDDNERLRRFRQRRSPIADAYEVSPHVTARAAHGHEVGHTAYEVSSSGDTLLIWGDVIHVPSIQFARPEITWGADANQDAARATRLKLLRKALSPDFYVAGAHLDFPGVGTVIEHEGSYSFKSF